MTIHDQFLGISKVCSCCSISDEFRYNSFKIIDDYFKRVIFPNCRRKLILPNLNKQAGGKTILEHMKTYSAYLNQHSQESKHSEVESFCEELEATIKANDEHNTEIASRTREEREARKNMRNMPRKTKSQGNDSLSAHSETSTSSPVQKHRRNSHNSAESK